jgi:hypothetical protein
MVNTGYLLLDQGFAFCVIILYGLDDKDGDNSDNQFAGTDGSISQRNRYSP